MWQKVPEKVLIRFINLSLLLIGIAMLYLCHDFSMSGDEASQIQIGRNIHVFLGRTFGLIPGSTEGIKLDNYSGLFGAISTAITHLFPKLDEIHLRHLMVAITGFFAIVFAGKTARLLHSRTAELLTIWMLACSPRFFGASMNDSKDIPFALGMIMTTYFLLRIVSDAPTIIRRHFAGLLIGLFIAIGVRINGMVFCGAYAAIAFFFLAYKYRRKEKNYIQKLAVWLTATGVAAFLTAIIFLPRVWSNIPLNTIKALHTFSTYKVAVTMLYMGKDIPTEQAPWHYLPVWVGITTPVIVLAFFLSSPVALRQKLNFSILLLLFTVLFPWLGIVAAHSPVYDAWRQFYFIFPAMGVWAGMSAAEIFQVKSSLIFKTIFAGITSLGLILPVLWSIKNHPMENVYFNEMIGGVDGAYGHFETDYYGEGIEQACKKLVRQPAFRKPLKDSIYILDNVPTQVIHYLKAYDPLISITHASYDHRDSSHWDYGIFYTRGLDSLLKRKDWPPAGMIDSVVADHTLLMTAVKNPNSR